MAENTVDRVDAIVQSGGLVRLSNILQKMKDPSGKDPFVRLFTRLTLLSSLASSRVLLKLEHLQPGGSFKSRGIGNYMSRQLTQLTTSPASAAPSGPSSSPVVHFFSSSGGNAGIACVTAAVALEQPSTVVVPLSTSQLMIAKLWAAGASHVIQDGATWFDADTYLREQVIPAAESQPEGLTPVYVPPFEHPDIWAGHATMIDEIAKDLLQMDIGVEAPSVIACSVGGGGLFNGVVKGVEAQVTKTASTSSREQEEMRSSQTRSKQSDGQAIGAGSWQNTVVLAVETIGADSLGTSLDNGRLTTLSGITSLATTLGAVTVSPTAYEFAASGVEAGRVRYARYSDAEAAMGVWKFAEYERTLVELSCGVTIAACFGDRLAKALKREVRRDDVLVLIVCGGTYVTTELVEKWRGMFSGDESLQSQQERP